jgi:catechol 2,3-dioxygenase-like lactoylglutathione lyase family enzyme
MICPVTCVLACPACARNFSVPEEGFPHNFQLEKILATTLALKPISESCGLFGAGTKAGCRSVEVIESAARHDELHMQQTHLHLVALVVREYQPAIDFFVQIMQFELVEYKPSTTNDGRPKLWVVVRPRGGETGILLARADGDHQESAVGNQFVGRVGLFLRVSDFHSSYERMVSAGVVFASEPRHEAFGEFAVFLDCEGNRWDLLGPA